MTKLRSWFAEWRRRRSRSPLVLPSDLNQAISNQLSRTAGQDFFFIQVGAYDGLTNDPVYDYVQQYRWKGILIEPQVSAFEKLKETYRDHSQLVFINAAIAEEDGMRDFYTVRSDVQDLPVWGQQIASFDLNHLLKHKYGVPDYGITENIPNIEELIQVEKVECLRFDTLLDHWNVSRIDLLNVDAEGYDAKIVASLNFKRLKPAIIHYEHMHLDREERLTCEALLRRQGYYIAHGFADTIAYLE